MASLASLFNIGATDPNAARATGTAGLTQAQIAQILAANGAGATIGGVNYAPTYAGGASTGEDGYTPGAVTGYIGVDPNHTQPGDAEYLYGQDGSYGQTTKLTNANGWGEMLLPLLAATGAQFLPGGMFGGGAAGSAAAGGVGADAAGAVASPVTAGIANGVDLGTLDGAGALGAGGGAAGAAAGDTAASLGDGIYGSMGDFGGTTASGGFSGLPSAGAAAGGAGGAGAAGNAGWLQQAASSLGVSPSSLIGGAGSLASGLIGAAGAKSAANAQANAAQNALTMQQGMFNTQVGLEAPFRAAGVGALSPLMYGLGLSSDGGPGAAAAGVGYGSLIKPFSTQDFQEDPGIQFQTQQGNLALQNSQAAKNGVLSGAALKDLIGYNSGMAATGYQSAYDRYVQNQKNQIAGLSGVVNTGQAAASNTANNAGNMASAMSSNITGIGNAQASGTVGATNALTSGITGGMNYYMLNSLLNRQQQPASTTQATGGNV